MLSIPQKEDMRIELLGLRNSLTGDFMMDKHVLLSKTFWVGLVTALAPLFPPIQTWIMTNPQAFAAIAGTVFIVLRKFTTKPVSLLPKSD